MKVTLATSEILKEVMAERLRQEAKWGEHTHEIFTNPDAEMERARHDFAATQCKILSDSVEELGWDLILLEEVYEAFAEEDYAKMRAELIQVAAVAISIVEDFDRKAKPL